MGNIYRYMCILCENVKILDKKKTFLNDEDIRSHWHYVILIYNDLPSFSEYYINTFNT